MARARHTTPLRQRSSAHLDSRLRGNDGEGRGSCPRRNDEEEGPPRGTPYTMLESPPLQRRAGLWRVRTRRGRKQVIGDIEEGFPVLARQAEAPFHLQRPSAELFVVAGDLQAGGLLRKARDGRISGEDVENPVLRSSPSHAMPVTLPNSGNDLLLIVSISIVCLASTSRRSSGVVSRSSSARRRRATSGAGCADRRPA